MTFRSIDVPRDCNDRQTVSAWQQARDFAEQTNRILETYTISLPVFPYGRELPRITGHVADANTVGLWHGAPPDNGGSGLIDSSGHGFLLAMGGGNERYAELGCGREGFLCDGGNYWKRSGATNDAALNLVGDMTIEAIARPLVRPVSPASLCVVSYGAPGETGGNDNVFWSLFTSDSNVGGGAVANMVTMSTFYETGAGADTFLQDSKIHHLNTPHHYAMVKSAGGATVTFYLDGFRQAVFTGQPTGTVGGAPTQCVRIGADHNAAGFFQGVIGSIKVSNVARSEAYIFSDAAHCLGLAQFETSHLRPLMRLAEPSVLLAADIVPDDRTGVHGATDTTVSLYRLNSSGSTLTQTKIASIDGAVASAKPWSSYRAQSMRVGHNKVTLAEDDIIAISGAGLLPNGVINLTFGRLS